MRSNKQIDLLNNKLALIAGKIARAYNERNELELNEVPNRQVRVLELENNIKALREKKKEIEAEIARLRKELEGNLFWV
ncbi:hypothetical protein CG478_000925 [Bacillus cytotoxicus]|uniref:hypothetical protein n=1 Tax=Bacillus cytotoxicus TaxID=580165 RepID=UPI000B965DBE|nr:hypothetical protein [Bacillus cytotoxicus]AWC27136.1 hypothetical protein CG483_000925 [Bacillus cytotoxicus]AWC39250.1 hypothetical protein CG480_000925 [Bacillus cytotoxicus]AWC47181.1 hypothetical protein CG478_000925 [Bacillus cytotoxicus]AWC51202.1 hypothetical protein CG477_000925 [Bacillus cytotoxicus]AWC55331.1 hypothetical protein CG476_000925 [Bacillus cytotoxicus]